ncbi:hypothetical protein C8R42DRAFT_642250 [Lentinula raphanica]|nr:hypothetical protein C8R42DRAFT_642250 [Lentinula raphanica]
MTTPLPKRDERSAPKFDPKNEALLPNFFAEFERTAKAAGIDDDARQMKQAVVGYLDAKTLQFWQTLDSFGDDRKSWEDFKSEVLDYYPGARSQVGATTEELVKIVESFRRKGISTAMDLNEFHREFAVVAKALSDQGVLSGNPLAKHYVAALPDHVRWRIDQALLTFFPDQDPGQAYTIGQLRKVATRLLADTSAPAGFENFRLGDLSSVPSSVNPPLPKVKQEPPEEAPQWVQQMAALTQVVNELKNEVREKGTSSREGRSSKSSKGCAWDGCPAKALKDCADLADWVAKGRVEQNERGYVNLKGGEGLPRDAKYQKGLVKERFERFFSENPTARTWILDVPAPSSPPPEKAGLDISQHTAYTLQGYQGPHMLATAAAYAMQSDDDPSEAAVVRDLIFKMETRRGNRDRNEAKSSSTTPPSKSKPNATKGDQPPIVQAADPEPSVPIPQRIVSQSKTTKPIIGKLPETYVPPQERNLGAPPKDDTKNYRYRAPIETEQAVERVVSTGLQSLVTIRQDDLLALAPDYRKRVKEAITSRRIGLDGALLEDTGLLEGINLLESEVHRKETVELPFSVYFNDYGPAKEGDEYYVAKETHPIRGVNAIVGERAAHCVLDSGCSLVAASLAACNAFGLAFDPERRINLQSANGTTNWSLGLAKDVPFRFGDVLAFLQVQVVDTPAYDFLLGRPFEVLMQATYKNFYSGDQHITLVDPNTSKAVTIPTLPREPPRFKKEDGRELRK